MINATAIVNIYTDVPRAGDVFFVDANVWLQFFDDRQKSNNDEKVTQAYTAYIKKCIDRGVTLLWSPLSWAELAHNIEEIEWMIFQARTGTTCSRKQFRAIAEQRTEVSTKVQIGLTFITTHAKVLPTPTDFEAFTAAVRYFDNLPLDGYDAFYVNAMRAAEVTAIITHDFDFAQVPGLTVFTASWRAIDQAKSCKKLLARFH